MAFIIPKKLGQVAITTGAGTLVYTAPTGITTLLKCLDLTNTAATALTVSVYLVPSGGTASTANVLCYSVLVPPAGQYQWTGTQILEPGGFIQAIASASGITINAAGGEYVV